MTGDGCELANCAKSSQPSELKSHSNAECTPSGAMPSSGRKDFPARPATTIPTDQRISQC
jgi:hypothetical protein